MKEAVMKRLYNSLKSGKRVDMTNFLREDQKEYIDGPRNGLDQQVIRVTLELSGSSDPAIIVSKFKRTKLVESHFYYLDQKGELKTLLHNWLNI